MNRVVGFFCGCSLVFLVTNTSLAAPINGGFELGDCTGWTLSIPTGNSVNGPPPFVRPAGTIDVVTSWRRGDMPDPAAAIAGNNFAALGTLDLGTFAGSLSYIISLRQTFSLNQGDVISGQSFFYNGDYEAQDSSWVKVFDSSNGEVADLWHEYSGGSGPNPPNSVEYRNATSWTDWEWTAPTSGDFTLELAVSTFGDNQLASFGFFDDVNVTPVPEPSSVTLLGMGLLAVLGMRKKFKGR